MNNEEAVWTRDHHLSNLRDTFGLYRAAVFMLHHVECLPSMHSNGQRRSSHTLVYWTTFSPWSKLASHQFKTCDWILALTSTWPLVYPPPVLGWLLQNVTVKHVASGQTRFSACGGRETEMSMRSLDAGNVGGDIVQTLIIIMGHVWWFAISGEAFGHHTMFYRIRKFIAVEIVDLVRHREIPRKWGNLNNQTDNLPFHTFSLPLLFVSFELSNSSVCHPC